MKGTCKVHFQKKGYWVYFSLSRKFQKQSCKSVGDLIFTMNLIYPPEARPEMLFHPKHSNKNHEATDSLPEPPFLPKSKFYLSKKG